MTYINYLCTVTHIALYRAAVNFRYAIALYCQIVSVSVPPTCTLQGCQEYSSDDTPSADTLSHFMHSALK